MSPTAPASVDRRHDRCRLVRRDRRVFDHPALTTALREQCRGRLSGGTVRRWVPELRDVPLDLLAEPWTMSAAQQDAAGCVTGVHCPAPIVDHRAERALALDRYRAVAEG